MSDTKPITVHITHNEIRLPVILMEENGVLYSAILSPVPLSQEDGREITKQAEKIYWSQVGGVVQ